MNTVSSYKVYSNRWWVLATLGLLNVTTNAFYISYAPISTTVAAYYEVSIDRINLLVTVVFVVGFFVGLMATWMLQRLGTRKVMLLAAIFLTAGGSIRLLSTLPFISNGANKSVQYWAAFTGQVLLGIANPMASCLPQKLSQEWFPVTETTIASGLTTMSFVLGVAISQGLTPLLFTKVSHVPYINVMWFIPSAVALIMAVVFVRSDKPPTPPSKSAELVSSGTHYRLTYLQRMRTVLTSKNIPVILFSLSGVTATCNAAISQLQQILCSRGYPDWFGGMCGVLILSCGIVGGILSSLLAQKTGYLVEIAKTIFGIGIILILIAVQVVRFPNYRAIVATLLATGGFSAFGVLPLCYELAAEAIYPLDPAISTSVAFVVTQIFSGLLLILSGFLKTDLGDRYLNIETCSVKDPDSDYDGIEPRDMTPYLLFLSSFVAAQAIVLIVGLKPYYKRKWAGQETKESAIEE